MITAVLRPITWGIPAACVVAGAVGLEERLSGRTPRWLTDAGDASYSIYLIHLFIIPVIYIVVSRTLPAMLWLPMIIALSLAASATLGKMSFVWLEMPLLRWLRQSPPGTIVPVARSDIASIGPP